MGPNTRIESTKAHTPPRSGDRYYDDLHGHVRLIRQGGGDSWVCAKIGEQPGSIRPRLSPKHMRRVHDE